MIRKPNLPVTAEQILKTGILNQWYLVCKSSDLGATPIRLTRLGRHIALWRDAEGKAHAVEDFCPHRGAPLSHGLVVDGKLACRYHGLAVDGTGTVTDVPPVHNCPLVGRKLIEGYPVREAAGAIWLYFSDGIDDHVPELELPNELTSPEWSGFIYAQEWNCHYQLPLDNRLDPMHAIYLHADSFTLAYGVKTSVINLTETEHGFVIERDNQLSEGCWRQLLRHRQPSHSDRRASHLSLGDAVPEIAGLAPRPVAFFVQEQARGAARLRHRAGQGDH
jgi:phenylpropionate dioxygenase-like ring-hydroxylating dioxygenase large terminal subunit